MVSVRGDSGRVPGQLLQCLVEELTGLVVDAGAAAFAGACDVEDADVLEPVVGHPGLVEVNEQQGALQALGEGAGELGAPLYGTGVEDKGAVAVLDVETGAGGVPGGVGFSEGVVAGDASVFCESAFGAVAADGDVMGEGGVQGGAVYTGLAAGDDAFRHSSGEPDS